MTFEQTYVARNPGSYDEGKGGYTAQAQSLDGVRTLRADDDGRWRRQELPGRRLGVCAVLHAALGAVVAISQRVQISASSLPRHWRLLQLTLGELLPLLVGIGSVGRQP